MGKKAEQAEKAKQDQSSSTETTTDEVSECFGGVGTSVANFGSAVQYTANKPLKENDTIKRCTIRGVQKGVHLNPLLNALFPIKFSTHNKGPNI